MPGLLLALWLTSLSAAEQQADQPVLVARAQEVVARLVSGEVEPLLPTFTDKMKAAIDANGLRRLIPGLVAQFRALTRYLAMLDGKVSAEEQTALDSVTKLAAAVRALKQPSDPPIVSPPFSAPASYWLDLRGYDPPAAASRLMQPMLVLQGERDYQVTMEDHAAWQRALGSRANVQLKSYPALNHMFMAGTGPSAPAEYNQPGHLDESVVRDIAAWITR